MEQFIVFVRDALIRLKSKSPKFFNVLKLIAATLGAFDSLALWLNSQYNLGWELIMLFSKIPLTSLLSNLLTFLIGIFAASTLTMSTQSENRDKLGIIDKPKGDVA